MLKPSTKINKGFTIVELLIVIVVIAILAAITVVAYNGIQNQAQQSKIKADLRNLYQAIIIARNNTGQTLYDIIGNESTDGPCLSQPDNTDLATNSDCVNAYNNAVTKISAAASVDVSGLLDPWGRPYAINENESISGGTPYCEKDTIAVYSHPFYSWQLMADTKQEIPNSIETCP